ncbi:PREDICTED: uncharacterized protein LOC109152642 [Ipomoea nil]|uniref:uncharacterized protein LOC109152642 n=1 Tax=Ipomoea nil TaxID=35883 RepID=UPI000901458A|nr:PREDICTED: uncharacterized protein LOC109152642 [Ipomoea nil]
MYAIQLFLCLKILIQTFTFTASQSVTHTNLNIEVPELRGDNYKIWKERVLLSLGWKGLDFAIHNEKPPVPAEDSTQDDIALYERCNKSNRLSTMYIKAKISDGIQGSVSEKHKDVQALLKSIDDQFVTSEKALASTLIMRFSSLRLTSVKGVREHIMELRDIVAQLKTLGVDMSDDFVVYYALYILPSPYGPFKIYYNTHKEKWSINNLMTMCVQEEGRLVMEMGESAMLATTHEKSKSGKSRGSTSKAKGKGKLSQRRCISVSSVKRRGT